MVIIDAGFDIVVLSDLDLNLDGAPPDQAPQPHVMLPLLKDEGDSSLKAGGCARHF